MPKVKLLVSRAGRDISQKVGEIVEVDEREASAMIANGQAENVAGAKPAKPKAAAKSKATKTEIGE
tara:strand:+ start:118 stop:315 length:198 start_codon:yes stop_codon:yes gene_type:complete